MALHRGDTPALVVTGIVAVPVAAGLLWAGAATPTISDAVVAALFLVAWLLLALPVAVFAGRYIARHVVPFEEEEGE